MNRALVFRAICVLDEAIEQARAGRVPASHGLRLALGYLYDVGDRRGEWFDREPYDDFWRVATQDDAALLEGSNAAGYGRSVTLTSYMNGIARAAGLPIEGDVVTALWRERVKRAGIAGVSSPAENAEP